MEVFVLAYFAHMELYAEAACYHVLECLFEFLCGITLSLYIFEFEHYFFTNIKHKALLINIIGINMRLHSIKINPIQNFLHIILLRPPDLNFPKLRQHNIDHTFAITSTTLYIFFR